MNFTASRYVIFFLNSEIYIMRVINHEWNRSIYVTSAVCFFHCMLCTGYKTRFSNRSTFFLYHQLNKFGFNKKTTRTTHNRKIERRKPQVIWLIWGSRASQMCVLISIHYVLLFQNNLAHDLHNEWEKLLSYQNLQVDHIWDP